MTKEIISVMYLLIALNYILIGQPQSWRQMRTHEENYTTPHSLTDCAIGQGDSTLSVIGRWAWGPCQAVDVKGSYAFIGNGPTFQVLDISNPTSPVIAAEYVTDGPIGDIRILDTLAYICGGKGFLILDVTNPFSPQKVGELSISATFRVVPTDSFAYLTSFGLFGVIEITDPTNPVTRSVVAAGDLATCLAINERYAYVGNLEWPELRFIDTHNPDSLKVLPDLIIGGWGINAYVHDTLLLVGVAEYDGNQSLKIFSVANPASPIELGRMGVGFTRSYEINSITTEGQYAFAAIEGHGIQAIDISDPTRPQIVDSLYKNALTSNVGYSISASQGILYAAYNSGLWVLNASRPNSLSEESFFIAGGNGPLGVAVDSHYAYVAVGSAGLAVLDITDPIHVVRIGAIMVPGTAISVAVDSNYAYVGADSVSIINISNRSSPQRIAAFAVGKSPIQVVHERNRLYTLIADSGTQIVDVSNPLMPKQIGFTTFGGHRMAVQNNVAYYAGGSGGLVIVDLSDPLNPSVLSSSLGWIGGILMRDTIAYAATDKGLTIVSIADPRNPRVLSSISTPGSRVVIDMVCSNQFLYMSYGDVFAIDISNPYSPSIVFCYTFPFGQSIAASGKYIYVGDVPNGLYVLRNNLITAVNSERDGLPREYCMDQNYPNPFNPRTTIEFYSPREDYISLEVFNVIGQKIATLLDGYMHSGKHSVFFDGSVLNSGVYYYRLVTSRGSITCKMMVIK